MGKEPVTKKGEKGAIPSYSLQTTNHSFRDLNKALMVVAAILELGTKTKRS